MQSRTLGEPCDSAAWSIHQLNNPTILGSGGQLPDDRSSNSSLPYYDANGDGFCTSNDVLRIVNYLNNQQGEGEAGGFSTIVAESMVFGRWQDLSRSADLPARCYSARSRNVEPVEGDSRKATRTAGTDTQRNRHAVKFRTRQSDLDAILAGIADDVARTKFPI